MGKMLLALVLVAGVWSRGGTMATGRGRSGVWNGENLGLSEVVQKGAWMESERVCGRWKGFGTEGWRS